MSCKDCETFRASDKTSFFRLGCANIEIRACEKHLKETFNRLRSHDDLLAACKLYQQRIELFRKMNPDIIIKLGSGLGLKQAEDKGKQAIAAAQIEPS